MVDAETKHEKAWQLVAERSGLVSAVEKHGYFIIEAKDLKRWGEREPRLMAKMDSLSDRPKVFRDHYLNILPLDRGTYIIFTDVDNTCYFQMPDSNERTGIIEFNPPADLSHFDTLTKGLCSGESETVDLAFHTSLLEEFCRTNGLRLTRRGRFGSGYFNFTLPGISEKVKIQNAQIEVDSVFESPDQVILIEAKIGFRSNFHIRQLYYPLCWLRSRTEKPITPLLLCYSNGEFQLNHFKLGEAFGDIELKEQKYFVIDEPSVTTIRLKHLLKFMPSAEEPGTKIPFPQADDLDKVVDTVKAVHTGCWQTEELMDIFGFVERQAGYYTNAARYLGLLTSREDSARPQLTATGQRLIAEKNRVSRTEILLKSMLLRPVFRQAILALAEEETETINRDEIKTLVAASRGDISGDTVGRRATTVQQWLRWLDKNCSFSE